MTSCEEPHLFPATEEYKTVKGVLTLATLKATDQYFGNLTWNASRQTLAWTPISERRFGD